MKRHFEVLDCTRLKCRRPIGPWQPGRKRPTTGDNTPPMAKTTNDAQARTGAVDELRATPKTAVRSSNWSSEATDNNEYRSRGAPVPFGGLVKISVKVEWKATPALRIRCEKQCSGRPCRHCRTAPLACYFTHATLEAAEADLTAASTALGIRRILDRDDLIKSYRDPATDSRTPDFFVVSDKGVIYTGGSKLAEHGGVADDDRHVGMLVSAPGLVGNTVHLPVFTTQIAPTILRFLGISPTELQAVQIEGTQPLPKLPL